LVGRESGEEGGNCEDIVAEADDRNDEESDTDEGE
jgi:hypothetical protein